MSTRPPLPAANACTNAPVNAAADSIDAKVAALRTPDIYPDRPPHIEVIETHMSWVFLTPTRVYKLKKPVRRPYLDFSTPAARLRNARAEVRLNRRLAGDVYLGVVALTRDAGRLALEGEGQPLDWLVKMRRLPRERMLDERIKSGRLRAEEVLPAVEKLAAFYRNAPPIAMSPGRYAARFARDIHDNHRELSNPAHGLGKERIERLTRCQMGFLRGGYALLAGRLAQGRLIEAHGDLRPEHICLTPEPRIIDCLEFNLDFRLLDSADELAFLAMECTRLGAPGVGELIFAVYARRNRDRPPPPLLWFYGALRACLRAKIALWHLHDHDPKERGRWIARAQEYLHLADRYCEALG